MSCLFFEQRPACGVFHRVGHFLPDYQQTYQQLLWATLKHRHLISKVFYYFYLFLDLLGHGIIQGNND